MSWFVELVAFFLVGKLCIYLLQIFPPAKKLAQILGQTAQYFLGCDLCLGVWVYFFLAWAFGFTFLGLRWVFLDYLLTGAITAFVAHLLSLGWKTKFEVLVID